MRERVAFWFDLMSTACSDGNRPHRIAEETAGRDPFLGQIRAFPVFSDFLATAANRLPNRVSNGWLRESGL
jgi:hypothetical protein